MNKQSDLDSRWLIQHAHVSKSSTVSFYRVEVEVKVEEGVEVEVE